MKTLIFFIFIQNANAVSYVPDDSKHIPFELPNFPSLDALERLVLLALFTIVFRPLLKQSHDPKIEKERKSILKWTLIVGALAVVIRFFRFLSGH